MSMASISEVAQALGVSIMTVRRRIKDGSLPAQKIGGIWRIKRHHVASVTGEQQEPHRSGDVMNRDALIGELSALVTAWRAKAARSFGQGRVDLDDCADALCVLIAKLRTHKDEGRRSYGVSEIAVYAQGERILSYPDDE